VSIVDHNPEYWDSRNKPSRQRGRVPRCPNFRPLENTMKQLIILALLFGATVVHADSEDDRNGSSSQNSSSGSSQQQGSNSSNSSDDGSPSSNSQQDSKFNQIQEKINQTPPGPREQLREQYPDLHLQKSAVMGDRG